MTKTLVLRSLAGGLLLACAPLPARVVPPISGVVVDARTGRPVARAQVHVRHEGRYDQVLPERRILGEGKADSDAAGRFRVETRLRPSLTLWPWLVTETRVVAVSAEGYRCSPPRVLEPRRPLRIALVPAFDAEDRRASCRPEEPGAGTPTASAGAPGHGEGLPDGVLTARATLGFGANCQGPVLDLSLAPDGRHAAWTERGAAGVAVRLASLGPERSRPVLVARTSELRGRRLAWTATGALVLATAPGPREIVPGSPLEVLWRPGDEALPAALDPTASPERPAPDAADRNDQLALRWADRTFVLLRRADAETGGVREWLRVVEPDHTSRSLPLPGEACSLGGRFGRPQERITADGSAALDLRWLEGGCRAVRLDLAAGSWKRLDRARAVGTCRESRRVPAFVLRSAMGEYAAELEQRLVEAGLDPRAAFTLWINPRAETRLTTRDAEGAPRTLAVPAFPLTTPLARVQVTAAGAATSVSPAPAASGWEPL